jgi:hypothetical protein
VKWISHTTEGMQSAPGLNWDYGNKWLDVWFHFERGDTNWALRLEVKFVWRPTVSILYSKWSEQESHDLLRGKIKDTTKAIRREWFPLKGNNAI